ncbi:unnamed protein product [Camellia sinensis]
MLSSLCCCTIAWQVETRRLSSLDANNGLMNIMWLVPQFCCLGLMEGLAEDGIEMFFCFHVSKRMAGYGKVFTDFVIGMGNFVSAITIYASRRWFRDTLNNSRLDKYYQMLAILSYVNLCKVRKRNIINCENGVPLLIGDDMYAMWMTMLYLTNAWKLKFTHAAASVNVF